MENRRKTRELALCSLFAALSAVLSQISIPIGPVPINLAHLSTFMAAGLLGAKYGAVSQMIFVLMGAVGLPVFAGFMGGIGRVLGPTGGYIVAYIPCAYITGFITERFGKSMKALIAAAYAGWVIVYVFGTLWYIYISRTNLMAALMVCIVPFLPGDVVKTLLSAYLVRRLHPVIHKNNGFQSEY